VSRRRILGLSWLVIVGLYRQQVLLKSCALDVLLDLSLTHPLRYRFAACTPLYIDNGEQAGGGVCEHIVSLFQTGSIGAAYKAERSITLLFSIALNESAVCV
jgi:hypothetical protein